MFYEEEYCDYEEELELEQDDDYDDYDDYYTEEYSQEVDQYYNY